MMKTSTFYSNLFESVLVIGGLLVLARPETTTGGDEEWSTWLMNGWMLWCGDNGEDEEQDVEAEAFWRTHRASRDEKTLLKLSWGMRAEAAANAATSTLLLVDILLLPLLLLLLLPPPIVFFGVSDSLTGICICLTQWAKALFARVVWGGILMSSWCWCWCCCCCCCCCFNEERSIRLLVCRSNSFSSAFCLLLCLCTFEMLWLHFHFNGYILIIFEYLPPFRSSILKPGFHLWKREKKRERKTRMKCQINK